jgi:PAS domain S-box-containing protein
MNDVTKTKGQLIEELAMAHQLNAELKNSASEHKRIEEAIKGSEARYRNLVENAHDVLWVFDLNLGYTYISPSVKRLRGYSVEEAMKQRLDQVLTPESSKKARELFERERNLEESGHRHGPDWSFTSEVEMIHKDGSTFWVEATMNPLHDEAGRIKGIMGITRDISERKRAEEELKKHRDDLEDLVKARTAELVKANEQLKKEIQERKQAEEALRESTEKYRIHFSLANDVMFSYDHLYRVLSVSPNVERLLGYKPEELVGRSFQDLNVLHPDYLDEAVDNAMHVLSGETIYSSIYEFITKDGTRKFGEVSGVPLIREGQVVGVISVARDVTERIKMANSIQESEERYRITLQSMPDAVSIIRIEDFRYLYVNDAFCKITGYTLEDVKEKTLFDLNLPATPAGLDYCLGIIKNN